MKKLIVGLCLVAVASSCVIARDLFVPAGDQQVNQASSVQSAPAKMSFPIQRFALSYVQAKDAANLLSGVLSEGEVISYDEKSNTLAVRADDKTIASLKKFIKQLDQQPLQVQVEAKIIEVKSGNGDTTNPTSLSSNFKVSKTSNPKDYISLTTTDVLSQAATSIGMYAQLISGNTEAYLQALSNMEGYNLIASPWITALNNEEAQILIGSKYGYLTSIISQTSTVQQVNFLEVGTKLRFTPHISSDGYVIMEIYPAVSEGTVSNGLPNENTTETKNKVLVKDGQSIVIGGLTKNYASQIETGVPILSSIPFLGTLFRSTSLLNEKREIMVVITPHIVTPEWLAQMSDKAKTFESKEGQAQEDHSRLIH